MYEKKQVVEEKSQFWWDFLNGNPITMARGPVGGSQNRDKRLLAFAGRAHFVIEVHDENHRWDTHSKWSNIEDAVKAYNNV